MPAAAEEPTQPEPRGLRDPGEPAAKSRQDAVPLAHADTVGSERLPHGDAGTVPEGYERRKQRHAEADHKAQYNDPGRDGERPQLERDLRRERGGKLVAGVQ